MFMDLLRLGWPDLANTNPGNVWDTLTLKNDSLSVCHSDLTGWLAFCPAASARPLANKTQRFLPSAPLGLSPRLAGLGGRSIRPPSENRPFLSLIPYSEWLPCLPSHVQRAGRRQCRVVLTLVLAASVTFHLDGSCLR